MSAFDTDNMATFEVEKKKHDFLKQNGDDLGKGDGGEGGGKSKNVILYFCMLLFS